MRNPLTMLTDAVNNLLHAFDSYPREWHDQGRLCEWELWHIDPDSGVWAVRTNGANLDLHAPGAPNAAAWPGGDDPYEGVTPVSVMPLPDGLMPYPEPVAEAIRTWVANHAGAPVIRTEIGLRWIGNEGSAEPIMFALTDIPR